MSKAEALIGALLSEDFLTQAIAANERISLEAAWLQALAKALQPLRDALRVHAEDVRERPIWTGARSKLLTLEEALKHDRKASLETATDQTLQDLLRDAGISIKGLAIQQKMADITLEDAQGRRMELGMLSAGQRNALLIAPALVVAESSPFGFFIMDDPVHAFDELRVDYVARQLMSVAERRRLVVFTHDERLREHLLSAPADVDCRSIQRAPGTGDIQLTSSSPMWEMLLDDAQALLQLDLGSDVVKGLTTALRGVCRQAVDNALRLLITREAIRAGQDTAIWLHSLEADKVRTTNERFKAAKKLLAGTHVASQVTAASDTLSAYRKWWDMASHGNDPLPGAELFTQEELDAARTACTELMA